MSKSLVPTSIPGLISALVTFTPGVSLMINIPRSKVLAETTFPLFLTSSNIP